MGNDYWVRCGRERLLALVSALVLGVFATREARACGPMGEPVNYFTFGEPVPMPGSEGVPRDTGIVLRGRGYGIGGSPVVPSWFALGDVVLTDADGTEVALQAVSDWSDAQPALVYAPAEPLEPETTYRVTASLKPQTVTRPADAEGDETLEFDFTTGSELLEPLALEGSIEAELAVKDVPVVQCDQCGTGCQQTGTRRALMASVQLPAPSGGMESLAYRGYLYLSDDRPANVTTKGNLSGDGYLVMIARSFQVAAGERPQIELEVPDEDLAYTPCFIAHVRDARNAAIVTQSKCLERVKPSDLYETGGSGGAGGAPPSVGGVASTTGGTASTTGGSAPGTGGSAPTTGGSAPTTGGSATDTGGRASVEAGAGGDSEIEPAADTTSEGCGCSVPGGSGADGAAWLAAVVGAGFFARRRRRADPAE